MTLKSKLGVTCPANLCMACTPINSTVVIGDSLRTKTIRFSATNDSAERIDSADRIDFLITTLQTWCCLYATDSMCLSSFALHREPHEIQYGHLISLRVIKIGTN